VFFLKKKLIYFLLLLCFPSVIYADIIGSCEGQLLEIDKYRQVIIDKPTIYQYKDKNIQKQGVDIKFGDSVIIAEINEDNHGRVRIKKKSYAIFYTDLGWIERENLLCQFHKPLLNKDGIERKIYTKPKPSKHSHEAIVKSYPRPDINSCNKFDCKTISRFQLRFVFAEDTINKKYLTSAFYNVNKPGRIDGWVDSGDALPWDTREALRPSDNIKQTVIYKSYQAASIQSNNVKDKIFISGNASGEWYSYHDRIPIIEKFFTNGKLVYKVAAPGIGLTCDSSIFEHDNLLQHINSLKHVDIFFLIDGTMSMEKWINKVKTLVDSIVNEFETEPDFSETCLRFGFRIYRDGYADKKLNCEKGVCEGINLPNDSCQECIMFRNKSNFKSEISKSLMKKIFIKKESQDDNCEALYNGLRRAELDIKPCLKNVKILFVIGDCGDRSNKIPNKLIKKLQRIERFAMFFVQVPKSFNSKKYSKAYKKFSDQGNRILSELYAKKYLKGYIINPYDYFIRLENTEDVINKLFPIIKQYTNSKEVNELISAFYRGEAISPYLKRKMKKHDLPVLFVHWVKYGNKFGEQWNQKVDHRVIDAFVIDSEEWVKEVWITDDEYDYYYRVLKKTSDSISEVSKQRRRFIKAFAETLRGIVGKPPIKDTGEELNKYVKNRLSITIRDDSKLLQYSLDDLSNIEPCELKRLKFYIEQKYNILEILGTYPNNKIILNRSNNFSEECFGISEKGRRIPMIDQINFGRRLAPKNIQDKTKYSYRHRQGDNWGYWLPVEFLP